MLIPEIHIRILWILVVGFSVIFVISPGACSIATYSVAFSAPGKPGRLAVPESLTEFTSSQRLCLSKLGSGIVFSICSLSPASD